MRGRGTHPAGIKHSLAQYSIALALSVPLFTPVVCARLPRACACVRSMQGLRVNKSEVAHEDSRDSAESLSGVPGEGV